MSGNEKEVKGTSVAEEQEKAPAKPIRGGRNLMILGLASVLIAVVTTAISLFIYRATGDIYLDRSRPGFIAEDEKFNGDDAKEIISNEGEVDKKTYDEYLKELDSIMGRIDKTADSFGPDALSDESLGIYFDGFEEEITE